MLQLVKKDFIIHKKIILMMLAVIVVYMLIDISPTFLAVLFAFSMALHIFSSDEKAQAKILLSSLPFTRKEIVRAKYIAALLYVIGVLAIVAIGNFLINQEQPDWRLMSFVIVASLCMVSIIYPICYQFESKYLLFLSVFCFAIYLLAANLFMEDLPTYIIEAVMKAVDFMQGDSMWLICLAACALYVVSSFISVKIYEKKEL